VHSNVLKILFKILNKDNDNKIARIFNDEILKNNIPIICNLNIDLKLLSFDF